MIELEDYPVLNADLHLMPKESIIILMPKESIIILKERMKSFKMNKTGAKILTLCDGSRKMKDILCDLSYPVDKYKDALFFVDKVFQAGFLKIYTQPRFKNLHITGAFDHYFPTRLLVELTYKCNLRCKHCSVKAGSGKKEKLPTQDLLKILAEFRSHGTINIEFTGGEPFLHPDLLKILDWSAKRFYTMVLATNGWFINEHVAKELAKYSNLIVQVSLDSSTPDYHDKLRGKKGAWKKAVEAIYNLTSQGVATRVEMTVTPENVNEIEDVIALLKKLNVAGMEYDIIRKVGRGKNKITIEDSTFLTSQAEAIFSKEKNFSITSTRMRKEFLSEDCGAGKTMWTIGPSGKIRPCNYLPEEYLTCGNVLKGDVTQIFKCNKCQFMANVPFPSVEYCKECKFFPYCEKCFCNGMIMYETLGKKCIWGEKVGLKKIIERGGEIS